MRVAIVTESFLPQVNGVTNSVLRVCEQLTRLEHEAMVIAPGPGPTEYSGFPVVRTPSVPLPGYKDFRLARPYPGLVDTLRSFEPDVVHLASPTVLGAQGAFAAHKLGVPIVAVYQTDLAGFMGRYRLGVAESGVWRWLRRVHETAARTLAPSSAAVEQLERNGIPRVARWARGVDLKRFHPAHRDNRIRRELAPHGEAIIGYVGRLAHEKEVHLLQQVQELPNTKLVIVGDGPQRRQLEGMLPKAEFLGFRGGSELATTFASFDMFVHTGSHETFCQAAQEALASGLPIIAPAAGGLLDLVDVGRTGFTFAPGSADDLTACVETLVGDRELRIEMGREARRSVRGRSWDVIGDQLERHYEEVVAA